MTPDEQAVDLATILRDVGAMIAPRAATAQVTYMLQPLDRPARVLADAVQLREVILGILRNAIRFTPAGGRITVDLATRFGVKDVLYLRISDTGVGMPRSREDAIFERARDARAPTTMQEGADLPRLREHMRAMGGDLRARSVEGAGTSFTVTIRRAPTDPT